MNTSVKGVEYRTAEEMEAARTRAFVLMREAKRVDINADVIRLKVEEICEQCAAWEENKNADNIDFSGELDDLRLQAAYLDEDAGRYLESMEEVQWDVFDMLFMAQGACCGHSSYINDDDDEVELDESDDAYFTKQARSKLERMTKKELLNTVRTCLKTYNDYMMLERSFVLMQAAEEAIAGRALAVLHIAEDVNEMYDKAMTGDTEAVRKFDRVLETLGREDARLWVA